MRSVCNHHSKNLQHHRIITGSHTHTYESESTCERRTKKKRTLKCTTHTTTGLFVFRHEKETNHGKEAWRQKRLRFAPSATNPMSDVRMRRARFVDDSDVADAIRLGIARRDAKRRTGVSNTEWCAKNLRRANDLQRPMRRS